MTIGTQVEILKSRIWLVLLLPLAASATAFFLTAQQPTAYATHATIILDYRKPVEGELAGELLPVGMQPSYLSTQIDIIRSRPVVEDVVDLLDLTNSTLWKERFALIGGESGELLSWLVDTLTANLNVFIGAESRLIDIWYQDPDPDMAARVANAFVESYYRIVKQLSGGPITDTAQSVDKLISKLRADLEQAERRVSEYQARTGIMATDERLDIETEHLNELMRQKLSTDASLRAAESRLSAPATPGIRGKTDDTAAEILASDLVQSLQIDLARKESELADLSTSLGDRHPQMQKLQAEVGSLREKLSAETEKVIAATRGEAVRARRLAEAARQAEEAQRKKVVELKGLRDGLQPLLRELDSARESYDQALQVYSKYAMHTDMGQTNISVLTPARVPETAVPRNVARNVASAFAGGFLFAIGLSFLWEWADRRVRGKDVQVGELGCLGGLPKA